MSAVTSTPSAQGLVEGREQPVGLTVQAPHGELDVRDLDREPGLAADGDDLVDRLPEPAVLAADVAHITASIGRGHPGQLDDLSGGRVDSGRILEPAR